MTSEAAAARRLALAFEAKKISYRQTKEGEVISFLLHPNDRPVDLLNAPLGQRYQVAAVALNDDDTAKEPESQARPARAKRSWDEMSPAQQAGMLCQDESFRKYLRTEYRSSISTTDEAARFVREYCGVASRSQINVHDTTANDCWQVLARNYRAWMHEPSVVPA